MKYKTTGLFALLCIIWIALFGVLGCDTVYASNDDFEFKWLIPQNYYNGTDYSEGRVWVQEKPKGPWTLFDDNGNILKEGFEADEIRAYREGYCQFKPVGKKNEYGYLDRSGDIAVSPNTASSSAYREGLIRKRDGDLGNWGYVDSEWQWVISPDYEGAYHFDNGLAPARLRMKWGFIDRSGKAVIDFQFDHIANYFIEGVTIAEKDSRYGLIDREGNWLKEPEYDEYFRLDHEVKLPGIIGVIKDGKAGFIDLKGDVVIDFGYEPLKSFMSGLYCFNNGRAVVVLDKEGRKYGVIDEGGRVLFRVKGAAGRLFSPSGAKREKIPALKEIFKHEKTFLYRAIYRGDYLAAMEGDKVIIFDRNGKRYIVSEYITPTTVIYTSENNIFKARDVAEHTFGYFTITVRN